MGSDDPQSSSIRKAWQAGGGDKEHNSICPNIHFRTSSIGGSIHREVTFGSNSTISHFEFPMHNDGGKLLILSTQPSCENLLW